MPSLNNREKQPETQPIWGQFHFFPNGSQIEMEASRHHLENNPSNFSLHATATASFSSHISNSGNPFLHHGDHRYPPIVLLPSSYDLAKTANGHAGEEGCFNVILVGGCLLLVGTVSAAVALISGFIWNVHNLFRKLVITPMSLIQHCPQQQQQPRPIEYTPCSSRQTGLKRQKERIKYLSIKFS